MGDMLVDYAIRNIWCNPRQDSQFTIKPKRITGKAGVRNSARVIDRIINLPTQNTRYHLFQVGQINVNRLNVFRDLPDWLFDRWFDCNTSTNRMNLTISIYDHQGVMLPGFTCFLMYMDERNLIIAIEETTKVPVNYSSGDFYFRVYQNTYFESDRFNGSVKLFTNGQRVRTMSEIMALQAQYLSYKERNGHCFSFVNGMLVKEISPVTTKIGDYAEFIYDASVARIVTFKISQLPTFISRKDGIRKYLLHYPFEENEIIEFFDDNELFVIKNTTNQYQGIYGYRHQESTYRMVTHRDYSLAVAPITYLGERLRDLIDKGVGLLEDYSVRMVIRYSGYNRPLVYEHHRLHELYKLDPTVLKETLLGTGDALYLWRSEELEDSQYAKLMAEEVTHIQKPQVIQALGYNAISKLLADTPQKLPLSVTNREIVLPSLLHANSTVYEYDQDGILLGYYFNVSGGQYLARNNNAVYFEALRGSGTDTPDVTFHRERFTHPGLCNWRLYRAHFKLDGQLDNQWEDITVSDDYQIVDNEIVYTQDDPGVYLMLRTDKKFLAYEIGMVPVDGNIRFSLSEMEVRDGVTQHRILPVPGGELDVFLNGKLLIEGIGYNVNFPEVCIFNKEYLNKPANTSQQTIHIRFKGLSTGNLQWEKPQDVGFIEHGVLSNNNKFDIRDDKVLRIIVDGCMRTREDLIFSELHSGVSIINASNGLPYMIRDIVVPVREIVDEDTYLFRARSEVVDRNVSEYMTVKKPQPIRDAPSAIEKRHEVFSPFICKILYSIIHGFIPKSTYTTNLTDQQVRNICKPFESWLAFDPITDTHAVDDRYVIIHPHNHYTTVVINLFAYRFMMRVVRLYAGEKVDLSAFVQIEESLV